MRVGFIGLGIMGSRMAANLQGAGYELRLYNRSAAKGAPLVARGAQWADSPAGAAGGVEILFTMLAHPEAVREMALGEGGFLDALPPGSLWVDCSTLHPSFSREMAAEAHARGVHFCDAPVGGSRQPAESAQLLFLVGGSEADVRRCEPLLMAMGNRVLHVGGVGMGTSLKLVANLLLATSMATFAEAMQFGQALGIPEGMLLQSMGSGPITAPFLASKVQKIAAGDYSADFPLRWMQKDLRMVEQAAGEVGVSTTLGSQANALYQQAIEMGLGDEDFSALYRALMADVQPSR